MGSKLAMFRSTRPPLRSAALLAAYVPFWFLGLYLLMASWHPTFSHTTDPISTLGGVGQPRAMVWNVLGFILPGVVIAAFGFCIWRTYRGLWTASTAGAALAFSGFLMALAGIFPAAVTDPTSWTNPVHEMSGWGSLAAFLVAGSLTPWLLWSRLGLRWVALSSLVLVFGTLAYQLLGANHWWLGQRVGLACYFLWVGLIGSVMTRDGVAELGMAGETTNLPTGLAQAQL